MLVSPCFNKKVQTSQVYIGSKQHQGEQVTLSTSCLTKSLCASRWCGFSCKSFSNNRRTPGSVKVLKTTCTSNRQGAHHKPLPPVQITSNIHSVQTGLHTPSRFSLIPGSTTMIASNHAEKDSKKCKNPNALSIHCCGMAKRIALEILTLAMN
jgi:hypothetical protein